MFAAEAAPTVLRSSLSVYGMSRLATLSAALLLAVLCILSLRWTLADLQMIRFGQALEALPRLETETARETLDPPWERALALRGPHPNYLDRRHRMERTLGLRLASADPVAAQGHLRRAEALAAEAFDAQPLPHHLIRAAAARADRYLVDATFADYLRRAAALGPWDAGTLAGLYAVLLPRWQHVGPEVRSWALDELVRLQASETAFRRVSGRIRRLGMWPTLCAEEGGAGLPEKHCPRDAQSPGLQENGRNLLADR
jgi:hypothetical protein